MKEIVLINPEKPANTGFIARLCKNFEFRMKLVNPKFNLEKSRKTAKKAQSVLRNVKIYSELVEAIEGGNKVLGSKMDRGKPIQEIKAAENVSLLVGRESSGLSNAELETCDQTVHIETSEYSSLNQSHAASVMMHQIFTN